MLTYNRDADFVARALAAPHTWPLILLRHTAAERRSDFKGRDFRRPLTGRGRTHARALIPLLAAYGVTQVLSSTSTRCTQTVEPYAGSIGSRVQGIPAVSEESAERRPKAALAKSLELAAVKKPLVLCSHRPVLPLLLEPYLTAVGKSDWALLKEPLRPGGMIVLHRTIAKNRWRITAVERHDG
jgi:8-oxo-dGTP diphosphatase